MSELHVRTYGEHGSFVVLLHGGPAAPGSLAPLGRALADDFRVLEPWQRGAGEQPLNVARHIEDLRALLASRCDGERPVLVGHSWGAMLALAFGAAHPGDVSGLALVGCGTFDEAGRDEFRQRFEAALEERPDIREALDRLRTDETDPDRRLAAIGSCIGPLYGSPDVAPDDPQDLGPCDARAHRETWDDMLRLQADGLHPAAFAAIDVPVLLLHGELDPHPGALIAESLRAHMPQLELHSWARCGHSPWLEPDVRDDFVERLRAWLNETAPRTAS